MRIPVPMIATAVVAAVLSVCCSEAPAADRAPGDGARPNVLVIYTDDVGYGDVSCYESGKIQTPRIDDLARTGRRFTRAYATAATCTPSRFSLLTGRYAFRNERAQILNGDAPLLIEPGSLTVASHLRAAGYHTAVFGKWHLGLGEGEVDWNGAVKPGPLEIGFHESYLMPSTNDRVPCVYLDGHRVENLNPEDPLRVSYREDLGDRPTGADRPDLLRFGGDAQHSGSIVNGVGRIGSMAGGHAAEWVDEELTDRFTERAISYITRRAAADKDQPWFVLLSLHQIHEPRVVHPRFEGKSGFGVRGDGMLEIDWSVGAMVDALERLGIRDETLIVFSSDNGPVITDGYDDGSLVANGEHTPAGAFRGGKYLLWEGGARVPFIASWPGRIAPGVSEALISQVDLLATVSALAGRPLTPDVERTLDSRDITPALVGSSDVAREVLLTQGVGGMTIRKGDWKFIPSGSQGPGWPIWKHNPPGNPLDSPRISAGRHLYNTDADPGERENLAAEHPERASRLAEMLDALVADPWAVEVMATP